jgi:signal transduction histidine kinase
MKHMREVTMAPKLSINADERRQKRPEIPLHDNKDIIARYPLSALTVTIAFVAIFFFGELLVTWLLMKFPIETPLIEGLVDSVVLVLVSSPVLYAFFYRPLRIHTETQERTEAEIHLLSQRLLHVAEEEQRKLALDLHDEFGQSVSALKLNLEEMRNKIEVLDPELAESCAGLISSVDEQHASIRSLVARLRPSLLDDLGIEPALQWLVSELQKQNPCTQLNLEVSGLKGRPSQQMETALFRISQEAISNALVHGKARKIDLTLTASYPDLILTIRDDGIGFDVESARYKKDGRVHFGLLSMRERTLALNGRFRVASQPGAGTTIRVVLPQQNPLNGEYDDAD